MVGPAVCHAGAIRGFEWRKMSESFRLGIPVGTHMATRRSPVLTVGRILGRAAVQLRAAAGRYSCKLLSTAVAVVRSVQIEFTYQERHFI